MPESRPRDGDRAGDVAVGDQPDAGAGLAALADDVVVAVAVEDDRGDVADLLALAPWPPLRGSPSTGALMSMTSAASGPTAIFSM